jgi:integrase
MSIDSGTSRTERQIAPGVTERHARSCKIGPRRSCTCTPTYRARIRTGPRGHLQTHTATFTSRDEAIAWVATVKANVAAGSLPPAKRGKAPTLEGTSVRFLERALAGEVLTRGRTRYSSATIANYEVALRRHVLPHVEPRADLELGSLTVDSIDTRALQGMADAVEHHSREMARLSAAAVNAVLRDCYQAGERDELPGRIELPPPDRPRDSKLEQADADRLLATALDDDKRLGRSLIGPLVPILIGAGLRMSEAAGLTWGDGLDLSDDVVVARIARATTKSASGERVIRLEAEYGDILRAHWVATGRPPIGSPVFAKPGGGPLARDGVVRSAFTRLQKATALERVTPHTLRHSHASWSAAAGVRAPELAARMGHGDPAFTQRRYVHALESERDAEVAKLADYRARARSNNEG